MQVRVLITGELGGENGVIPHQELFHQEGGRNDARG